MSGTPPRLRITAERPVSELFIHCCWLIFVIALVEATFAIAMLFFGGQR